MFSNHVLDKEIESSEPSMMETKNFAALVTEEILYRKMIDNHKMFMLLLVAFHILLIAFSSLNIFYKAIVFEEVFICQYISQAQSLTYIALNILLANFALNSIFRDKALIKDMAFYENCKRTLTTGMFASFLLVGAKFFPEFFCSNISLGMYHSLILTAHIFLENLAMYAYVSWFKNELRNFGSLIN